MWAAKARQRTEWMLPGKAVTMLANYYRDRDEQSEPFKESDFNPHAKEEQSQAVGYAGIEILRLFVKQKPKKKPKKKKGWKRGRRSNR